MQPENSPEFSYPDQWLTGDWLNYVGSAATQSGRRHSGFDSSFNYPTEQEEAFEFVEKQRNRTGFAASENHKVAERKRRERINGQLDRLRALLLCNSKIDKASLLEKVVQRVRELKEQTSEISQSDRTICPSDVDEVAVVLQDDYSGDGKLVYKASLCCEDRVGLIPDLIDILKPLPLSILRAEIVTMGGRVRNVMFLAGEKNQHETDESVLVLRNALETLAERSRSIYVGGERSKRRRMFDQMI